MIAKTVLLVDDDVNILEPTQYLLIEEGYNVLTASNGKEAIEIFNENKQDIIFMDLKMPILNGYDAFNKMIEKCKNAKIIFTSGYAIDDEQFQAAKKKGLIDMLTKPFDIDSMIKMIKKFAS